MLQYIQNKLKLNSTQVDNFCEIARATTAFPKKELWKLLKKSYILSQ